MNVSGIRGARIKKKFGVCKLTERSVVDVGELHRQTHEQLLQVRVLAQVATPGIEKFIAPANLAIASHLRTTLLTPTMLAGPVVTPNLSEGELFAVVI